MSNKKKDRLLGEPHGTASARLRKMLLFKLAGLAGLDSCCRCSKKIETVEELSIEHQTAWQSAPDPRAAFFNLDDIGFSHLRCNVDARNATNGNTDKDRCEKGHEFTEANTYRFIQDGTPRRACRICHRDRMRIKRAGSSVDRVPAF